jgi:nitrate/TMAO reductase-like tetraheme cytochrome c subunit
MTSEKTTERKRVPWFKRKRIRILIIIVFLLCGGIGLLEWTHQPRFCLSCHIMKPYYDAWKSSTHNHVTCVKCHYEPGYQAEIRGKFEALTMLVSYMNGTYGTMPAAQIKDVSCLRTGCHETRLQDSVIEFKQGIKFDHNKHVGKPVRGITLRCTSCHSQIVQGDHMSVTESVCFTCHFKNKVSAEMVRDQKFCTSCHMPPATPIKIGDIEYQHSYYVNIGVSCQRCHEDVVKGDGKVDIQRCMQCHPKKDHVSRWKEFEFLHNKHVAEVKIECFECHDEIVHKMPDRGTPPVTECALCHLDTHNSSRNLYLGMGGKGIPDPEPAAMFIAQVDCIGCHTDDTRFETGTITTSVSTADVSACKECHPSGGEDIYNHWEKTISEMMPSLEKKLIKAQGVIARMPADNPKRAEMQTKFADAKYNYDFIRAGNPIHNIDYAQDLVAKSNTWLDEIIAGK